MASVPPVLTGSTVYLRLVGDRTIPEEKFGTIQKDRTETIDKWTREIKNKERIEHVLAFSNNHFQGFGPATVNLFRRSMGLDGIEWREKMSLKPPSNQKTLF